MASCAQLSQFDEELYKVTGWSPSRAMQLQFAYACAYVCDKTCKRTPHKAAVNCRFLNTCYQWEQVQISPCCTAASGEGEHKYLVATAEQPLCAMHKDQWFEEKELPLKYVAYSSCFRKEAGSHGRDTAGIFRYISLYVTVSETIFLSLLKPAGSQCKRQSFVQILLLLLAWKLWHVSALQGAPVWEGRAVYCDFPKRRCILACLWGDGKERRGLLSKPESPLSACQCCLRSSK